MNGIGSNNMWYFRDPTAVGNDDNSYDSIMLPVDQITGIGAKNNSGRIAIYFEHQPGKPTVHGAQANGYVQLSITAGKQKEVLQFLAQAANSSTHHAGFQTIADDVTGEYAFRQITSVSVIYNR